jgi:hypothetical protein
LIKELREENEKLKKLMEKGTVGLSNGSTIDGLSPEGNTSFELSFELISLFELSQFKEFIHKV